MVRWTGRKWREWKKIRGWMKRWKGCDGWCIIVAWKKRSHTGYMMKPLIQLQWQGKNTSSAALALNADITQTWKSLSALNARRGWRIKEKVGKNPSKNKNMNRSPLACDGSYHLQAGGLFCVFPYPFHQLAKPTTHKTLTIGGTRYRNRNKIFYYDLTCI